jgi:hypothetical protein
MNSARGTDRTRWMFAYFAFIGSFVVVRVVYLPPLLAHLGLSGAQGLLAASPTSRSSSAGWCAARTCSSQVDDCPQGSGIV